MATPPPRRPLSNTSNITPRTSMASPSGLSRPLGSTSPATGQGLARNPSLRGRPVRKTPTRPSVGVEEDDENESTDSTSQVIATLKEHVERADQASEQYRKQLEILQQRLEEATDQQTAAEERDFAARTQIDKLLAEVKEQARQRREVEMTFESERSMLMREKERLSAREADLQSIVQRLNDTIRTKNLERASSARSEQLNTEDVQTPTQLSSGQDELLQILQEKDATIDALRLELADVHIRVAEQEHMGDGRLQALEKQLSDIKMQNARLVEENDSFQMLLGEKTLKGDFLHDTQAEAGGMSSLAEELESIGENDEVSVEQYKKLEADLKNIKEEKKALTLYIDKIIGRLLQHDGFEHIITGKDADAGAPSPPAKQPAKEKPLPLAPAANIADAPQGPETPTMMGGLLQRARSVVSRGAAARPTRPMSFLQAAPTANENPDTAPSIPIRGHRRTRSDQAQALDAASAPTAPQPGKSSPLRTASGSPMTQGLSPLARAQTSYFVPPNRTETIRAPSQTRPGEPTSSSANSVTSAESQDRQSTEATSAQASLNARDPHRESMGPLVTAGVMKQSQLRPLRLVQNQDAEDEARKKGNRQSWMGNWFTKGGVEANQ